MTRSMTGYGKAQAKLTNGNFTIEIRSLNGKNTDINLKTSLIPKDKELEVRKMIAEVLQRGTIDVFITWEPNAAQSAQKINFDLALEYYKQVSELAKAMGNDGGDNGTLLSTILRLPDVIGSGKQEVIAEGEWPIVEQAFKEALEMIDNFRKTEGEVLYNDVTGRVSTILSLYDEVETFAAERLDAIKKRILKAAEDLQMNPERFEQEMIFYLEKLDINEEKVRLRQHCKYFLDTINSEPYPGKKLGFIIQEMGREINTTGSKANHASIQKCVVRMKDELEKIREQSMNIL